MFIPDREERRFKTREEEAIFVKETVFSCQQSACVTSDLQSFSAVGKPPAFSVREDCCGERVGRQQKALVQTGRQCLSCPVVSVLPAVCRTVCSSLLDHCWLISLGFVCVCQPFI